jgi:peptide/nickel transport system permease protein/oligopeptide transport system permease protein
MLGDYASEQQVRDLRASLGLDRPLVEQYGRFLARLAAGDLGTSIRARQPVFHMIGLALPATLELAGAALLIALLVGIPVGVVAALRPRGAFDNAAMFFALLGQAVPSFWLGATLIMVFSIHLGVLPTSGRGELRHLVLPALALAPLSIGLLIRITRASLLDVLQQDYVRTARAKGVDEGVVVTRHALRNAFIPVVTIVGLQIGALLGGAVVTETVFAWPGLGGLAVNALFNRDYPVIQGVILLSAFTFIAINLFVDVLYAVTDPRVRYR